MNSQASCFHSTVCIETYTSLESETDEIGVKQMNLLRPRHQKSTCLCQVSLISEGAV